MSKIDLCASAGISRPTLDGIERGEGNIRLDKLDRMAKAFRIESLYLVKPLNEIEAEFWESTGWCYRS